jgi:type I restriction enzyme R subunit
VDAAWLAFIAVRKADELDRIVAEEGLDGVATRRFIENAFRDGAIPTTGTAITKILPPVSRFAPDSAHSTKKRTVLEKLSIFFDRYFGLAKDPSNGE